MLRRLRAVAAIVLPLALPAAALAQQTLDRPVGVRVPYVLDTGPVAAGGAAERTVFSREVTIQGAAWVRLHFAAAELAPGAAVVVTSARDRESQRLDAAGLAMWANSTAYFNGDTVLVEIVSASKQPSRLVGAEAEAEFPLGDRGDDGQCGICNTDDRTLSTQNFAARFMPVGCSASIVCDDNTFVTAGHCMSGNVVQFNVPASQANCNLVNPPVADQFPVIGGTQRSQNAGVGADWGVFRAGTNNLGQTPFARFGQFRPVAPNAPAEGSVINNFAYGADTTCTRNQVQQRSLGNITQVFAASYRLNADVRGGSSGSSILVANQIVGVVTHCSGDGCGNSATRVDLQAFRNAINEIQNCDTTFVLQLRATNIAGGAPVATTVVVNPVDNVGNGTSTTPFDRTYLEGVNVTLTAPPQSAGLCFQRWELNGQDQGSALALTLTVGAAATATARYGACCQTDWNNDSSVNSTDISAFLTTWIDSVTNANLNADFNDDNTVNSADVSAFLTQWIAEVTAGC